MANPKPGSVDFARVMPEASNRKILSSIFQCTGEFLEQFRFYLEQNPPQISLASVIGLKVMAGSKTHDFASVADGAVANTTVGVAGAAVGDFAVASLNVAGGVPANAVLAASVTAADTVTVTLFNKTGAALDLSSGTLRALVFRV